MFSGTFTGCQGEFIATGEGVADMTAMFSQ